MLASEEQGLKVTQLYPARGWERQTIEAFEDCVVIERKNIFQEWTSEYKYSELKSHVIEGKTGDPTWTTIGSFFIACAFIGTLLIIWIFPNGISSEARQLVALGFVILAIFSFSFRFIKQEHVWFYEKDNTFAFDIVMQNQDRPEREQFVDYIIDKIEKAERLQSLQKI